MDTKQHIIQTALKLFLSKGFKETSMNEIAQGVGISKPAIYHYFNNKDTLIEAIFDHFTNRMTQWSQHNITQSRTNKEKIHNLFSSIATFMHVEKILLDDEVTNLPYSYDMFILLMSRMNESYKSRISRDFNKTQEKLTEIFTELQAENTIRDDINPATLARMMHSILEGISFLGELIKNIPIDEESEKLYKAFWKLIQKES